MGEFPNPREAYAALFEARPALFANAAGGSIAIVTDPAEMRATEAQVREQYRAQGRPVHWAAAGCFYDDPWITVLRDLVRFDDGRAGTYHRMLLKGSIDSVVVMPRYRGELILLRHFRHAIRDWSWEFPRGRVEVGDSAEATVAKELREEIGAEVEALSYLGRMQTDTSLTDNNMLMYEAKLASVGAANSAEGISALRRVSPAEIKTMILEGEITDVMTITAVALALLRGIFA